MKKSIFISFLIFASSAFVFAQQHKVVAPPQFTKTELLAFSDLKSLLSAINNGQDYSKCIVRNFNLTTNIINPDGTSTKLSEMGPGGTWSEKQKSMMEKYAKEGVSFTLENIRMVEGGKKGMINQSDVSFSIKE